MNFYHCCGFDCVCVKTRHVYLYNSDDDNEGNDDDERDHKAYNNDDDDDGL